MKKLGNFGEILRARNHLVRQDAHSLTLVEMSLIYNFFHILSVKLEHLYRLEIRSLDYQRKKKLQAFMFLKPLTCIQETNRCFFFANSSEHSSLKSLNPVGNFGIFKRNFNFGMVN